MTVLQLKAQQDALQKAATTRDPIKALAEFVWNALDADATEIAVELDRNALDGLDGIAVRDNGKGITGERANTDFENWGASWKRSRSRTDLNRAIHGKEGQGRLRFYSLADKARWASIYEADGELRKLTIDISANALGKADVQEAELGEHDRNTGTVVVLRPLKEKYDWLSTDEARLEFTAIFAPYVLQYPDVAIIFDGRRIEPASSIVNARELPAHSVICPTRIVKDLTIKIIEWKQSTGGRKIHFGGESGVVLGSLPANVTAPGFEFSAYAYTPFFQEIADANLLEIDGLSDPDFAAVVEHIRTELTDHFRARLAEKSGELIQQLKDDGVYPYEGDPKDEVEKRERQVLDIAIHAVASYSRDFKKAENPLKKMTLGLLREALRHNPEAIHIILHHVFNLPRSRQDEFSSLLQKTNLGNIISASTLIADRIVALEVLKGVVFNPIHRRTVKERGELDVLIQANTWIFGENFHITLAEAGLTRVMDRVSEELGAKRRKGRVSKLDGSTGRVDSFLGRIVPHPHALHREFLLIELKRPSLTITRKELDQLEDYVNAIQELPEYKDTSNMWHFYLITGDYDETVKSRVTQKDRPVGLLMEHPSHMVWVKTWGQIVRECEARLHFIAEKLQVEVTTDEIEARIAQLKASILKIDPRSPPPADVDAQADAEDMNAPA
ncbi:ATP-binding protein [Xanthobacter sp. YC-JY1]|uniref:ATP-binding protein n=1 Tax=Xanthobacter sp. YC-JY1 TaxID=2419844 RepID=UPI001F48E02A|nr:ATP-binding protein [Xanthobacter sp. YC-JY1]UJX46356.1 hypothetical protein D7006_17690 [Xanthobacter sp. YC-JY1]